MVTANAVLMQPTAGRVSLKAGRPVIAHSIGFLSSRKLVASRLWQLKAAADDGVQQVCWISGTAYYITLCCIYPVFNQSDHGHHLVKWHRETTFSHHSRHVPWLQDPLNLLAQDAQQLAQNLELAQKAASRRIQRRRCGSGH